jgi:hypothetical protein
MSNLIAHVGGHGGGLFAVTILVLIVVMVFSAGQDAARRDR